jgi:lipopolysaccharide/colanic/teichoic acid biosynthesis glycosyltransferase
MSPKLRRTLSRRPRRCHGRGAAASPPATSYVTIKSLVDRAVAALLLVAAAPLLLALALLVKLTSRGPVFYSQVRLGLHGRAYRVYKVRTMLHDCEAATGPVWAAQDDPRVTPVGRFLRETHLDELPQLWNVLRGDMSLIGPRPERPEIARQLERVIPAYPQRLRARPGITGLAQLQLPPDSDVTGVRRKLAYDLYYVRRVSPGLDLRLAASTLLYLSARLSKATSELLIKSHRRRAAAAVASANRATAAPSPELQLPRVGQTSRPSDPRSEARAA